MTPRHEALPLSLPPRGLSRAEAAAYVGIGATLFDQMVSDGVMPKPKEIRGRRVWDRLALDEAFTVLPDQGGEAPDNPWDRRG